MINKPTRGNQCNVTEAIRLYKLGYSMNAIGKILGHSHGVIAYHIYKNNIPIHIPRQQRSPISTDYIVKLYTKDKLSTCIIAEKTGLTAQGIYNRLLRAKVKTRTFKEALQLASQMGRKKQQMGEKNARWKGGKYTNKNGYIELNINGKHFTEHRYIWEKHNGKIPKGWIIHHLNGNRSDNRIENLATMPRKRHSPTKIIEPYRERILQLEKIIHKFKKEE